MQIAPWNCCYLAEIIQAVILCRHQAIKLLWHLSLCFSDKCVKNLLLFLLLHHRGRIANLDQQIRTGILCLSGQLTAFFKQKLCSSIQLWSSNLRSFNFSGLCISEVAALASS